MAKTNSSDAASSLPAPRASLSRFLTRYYVLNALVPVAYVVLRQFVSSKELFEREGFLNIPREHEIFLLVGALFLMNYRKKATLDGVMAMTMMYLKVGTLACLFYLDRRLLGWMLAYCAVLFIAVGYPKYNGPDNITKLNPASIEQYIKRGGGYKSTGKNEAWLVYFYTDWSDHCLQHDAMIAELSLQYGSETLKFGKVDLDQYPDLAREHQIDVSTTSSQLPTLVLFQGGEEVDRLPRITESGIAQKVILHKRGLIAVFRLQELHDGKTKSPFGKSKKKN
ncbi:hypothetical protein P43SY_009309 [Pythium insidiosum]|uniref:Thioredoxin domain-containing protein n=1 Tax=Pythium insidiosum TaxID=114742 RepID=A0AAD5Q6B9_PYTIN|nr:hypothetical protein P43SY_009309 [Pythium insidiosum]